MQIQQNLSGYYSNNQNQTSFKSLVIKNKCLVNYYPLENLEKIIRENSTIQEMTKQLERVKTNLIVEYGENTTGMYILYRFGEKKGAYFDMIALENYCFKESIYSQAERFSRSKKFMDGLKNYIDKMVEEPIDNNRQIANITDVNYVDVSDAKQNKPFWQRLFRK